MKRTYRNLICLFLSLLFFFGIIPPTYTFASEPSLTIEEAVDLYSGNPTQSNGYSLHSCTITDPEIIQALVNSGDISLDENGKLPASVTIDRYSNANRSMNQIYTYNFPGVNAPNYEILPGPDTPTLSIAKTDLPSWKGDDLISEDVIMDGDTLSASFSSSDTASWTTSMTTSVEVGGKIFTVAELKGSVSVQLGATIGSTVTITKTVTSTAPEGMRRVIQIYLNIGGFQYTGKVKGIAIGTGRAWKPIGLYVIHTDYEIANL